jgi:hypothetical protein
MIFFILRKKLINCCVYDFKEKTNVLQSESVYIKKKYTSHSSTFALDIHSDHHRRAIKNGQEKLATCGTQDKEKQSKNTTQYVLDTTIKVL